MNSVSGVVKSNSNPRSPYRDSSKNDPCVDKPLEEPPGHHTTITQITKEPPGKKSAMGNVLFTEIPDFQWQDWKWHFRNRINTIGKLRKYIPLSSSEQAQIEHVASKYPFSITPYYLSLIELENPDDPIRKQAIPSILELTMGTIGSEDPLDEKSCSVVPGLVHRYPDRVLMVLTDICPMFCRHCTRKREWLGGGWIRNTSEVDAMIAYIRNNKQIRDVIISGGDPLTLSTEHLEFIISKIRSIKHVEIIRIGTRFPVVLPQRIDDELCNMLSHYGPIWLNTHFNHHHEITPESEAACDRLLRSGIPINNQSVLLRGINDTIESQLKLSKGLLRIKVRPYYLFQCDEVQGTEHLRTPVEVGIAIIKGMRGHTSGLAVPTFVIDLPQGGGKVPLQPDYLLSQSNGTLLFKNYQGRVFYYRNPAILPDSLIGSKEPEIFCSRESEENKNRIAAKVPACT